jgi:acyl carrier protein
MPLNRERIVAYLVDELGLDEDDARDDDALLFSTGTLDSFGLVSLMQFLEDHGRFKIKATEVSLDHFDTIGRIVAFVSRRMAS